MSSSSGILIDAFETVNDHFTSLEPLGTHGHNVLVRAKRFGRWYCLKALAPEEADQTAYHEMLVKEFEIMMRLQHSGVVQAYSLESVDVKNFLAVGKAHLHINLGKFRLSVCSEVLVSEALDDLVHR